MSRRRKATKREITPDPRYGDLVLAKFITSLMFHEKKSTAEKVIYSALDKIGLFFFGGVVFFARPFGIVNVQMYGNEILWKVVGNPFY